MQEAVIDPRLTRAIILMAVITLPLKAWALWRAAGAKQIGWFGAMLLLNSIGILELLYLFYFSKSPSKAKE